MRVSPYLYQEEEKDKSLETLTSGEGIGTFASQPYPCSSCFSSPLQHRILCLRQGMGHFRVARLCWVSPLCTGGIHVFKYVFFFLLLIHFFKITDHSAKNQEEQKENYFFSPTLKNVSFLIYKIRIIKLIVPPLGLLLELDNIVPGAQ